MTLEIILTPEFVKLWGDYINSGQPLRSDIRLMFKLIHAGWHPQFNSQDIRFKRTTPQSFPADAVSYTKGNMHIWQCRDGWQVAETDDRGNYIKHRGNSFGGLRLYPDRFMDTQGFIPTIEQVYELDQKGEL